MQHRPEPAKTLFSFATPPHHIQPNVTKTARLLPRHSENRSMISSAFAQTATAAGPEGTLIGMLPILLMFGLLYFLMIRPQMKKGKEQKSMIEALAKGAAATITSSPNCVPT